MDYSRKDPNRRRKIEHGISRGIGEKACEISMSLGFPVVTVVILIHILQKHSLKQSKMQIFYVSIFYFSVNWKLENCHDKV